MLRVCVFILCLLLVGCAGQPNGSHRFSVLPNDKEKGIWKLDGLARNGRIDLTMRLLGDSDRAAVAALRFNYRDEADVGVGVDFSDRACRGSYLISLSHDRGRDRLTDYLQARLPWEQVAYVRVEWRSGTRFALTVDGKEQKIVDLEAPVENIVVEVRYGEVLVDDLSYTQVAEAVPMLPPEQPR